MKVGINLIIACHDHRVHSYSMRGEEPADLQWWFRNHADCFERGRVGIYRDCDAYPEEYDFAWRPGYVAPVARPASPTGKEEGR